MKDFKKLSIVSIVMLAVLFSTPKVEARMTFWDFKNKFVQTVKDYSGKAKDEYNKVKENLKQEETTTTEVQEETEWNIVDYPDYWKSLGKSDIDFNQFPVNAGEYKYAKLDELGRTGTAYGVITLEKVRESAGWRQSWKGDVDPSGFKGNNKKVKFKSSKTKGKFYEADFYNRSHLIADSLGGDSIKRNVVTGTRMQNVGKNNKKGGMQYIEMKVLNYVKRTGKNVYYKAEPVYKENELVPRYVIVNAKSEDGKINEKVLVFNTAEGYTIDYNTGKFHKN